VLVGAAMACIYIPSVAAVGEWFKARRDIALGVAISGIGCGTLVSAPLAAYLTTRFGWRTAFELFGWVSMAILLGCAALLSRPPVLRGKDTANIPAMLRTRTFALLYVSLIFDGIAIYIPFVFITAYAMDLGATHVAGAALIGYIGAASVIGRLGLNALAPRFGLLNVYKASYAIVLASCVIWLVSHSYPMLILFSLVLGVGYGGIAAMTPAVASGEVRHRGTGRVAGASVYRVRRRLPDWAATGGSPGRCDTRLQVARVCSGGSGLRRRGDGYCLTPVGAGRQSRAGSSDGRLVSRSLYLYRTPCEKSQ
jgi:MFS family permease